MPGVEFDGWRAGRVDLRASRVLSIDGFLDFPMRPPIGVFLLGMVGAAVGLLGSGPAAAEPWPVPRATDVRPRAIGSPSWLAGGGLSDSAVVELMGDPPLSARPEPGELATPELPDGREAALPTAGGDSAQAAGPVAALREDPFGGEPGLVRRMLEEFLDGPKRGVVERWFARSGRYLQMIREVLNRKGLPDELVFVAMVESGFNPVAVSRAGAKGLWQFMAPTARRYGLRVDRWLDERFDPKKSTVAAAKYLRDLYAMFGSWPLAHAAYNAGEGRVSRAVQSLGTKDVWTLAQAQALADETRDFVALIRAVSLIGQDPSRHGLSVILDDPVEYEVLETPPARSLKRIAALSGIPADELARLNPELRLGQTPPGRRYPLKVPAGQVQQVRVALERADDRHRGGARTSARGRITLREPRARVADAAQPAAAARRSPRGGGGASASDATGGGVWLDPGVAGASDWPQVTWLFPGGPGAAHGAPR
jgi:hypothetical protein